MASRLTNLRIDEVSLVPSPANKGAQIHLFKMHKAGAKGFSEAMDEFQARMDAGEMMDQVQQMYYALESSVYSILGDEEVTDKQARIEETFKAYATALSEVMGKVQKQLEGDMSEDVEKLKKSVDDLNAKLADVTKANEKLTADNKTLTDENAALKAKIPAEEGIDKSKLPKEVQEHLEKAEKQRADDAERIAKLEDANLTQEITKQLEPFKKVGFDKPKTIALLKSMKPDDRETLLGILKGADEQIAKGKLFSENGAGGGEGDNTTIDKVNDMVTDLRKQDSNLSEHQARARVFKAHPELRQPYNEEIRARV